MNETELLTAATQLLIDFASLRIDLELWSAIAGTVSMVATVADYLDRR